MSLPTITHVKIFHILLCPYHLFVVYANLITAFEVKSVKHLKWTFIEFKVTDVWKWFYAQHNVTHRYSCLNINSFGSHPSIEHSCDKSC